MTSIQELLETAGWSYSREGQWLIATAPTALVEAPVALLDATSLADDEADELARTPPIKNVPVLLACADGAELASRAKGNYTPLSMQSIVAALFGVDAYLDNLPHSIARLLGDTALTVPLKTHVPLTGAEVGENIKSERVVLAQRIAARVEAGNSVCVLTGVGGAGKTTTALRALDYVLKDHPRPSGVATPHAPVLPIVITGASVRHDPTRDTLGDAWSRVSPLIGVSIDNILHLLSRWYRLLLVVDGLDEFPGDTRLSRAQVLDTIIRRVPDFDSLIVTVREDPGGDYPELDTGTLSQILGQREKALYRYEVHDLSTAAAETIIQETLKEAGFDDPSRAARDFYELLRDQDLGYAGNPLFLQSTVTTYASRGREWLEVPPQSVSKVALVVEAFANVWIDREWGEKSRRSIERQGKLHLLEELAAISVLRGSDTIQARDLRNVVRWLVDAKKLVSSEAVVIEELRYTGILYETSDGYRFGLPAFRDFFLARRLCDEIELGPTSPLGSTLPLLGSVPFASVKIHADIIASYLAYISSADIGRSDLFDLLKMTRELAFRGFNPHRALGANLLLILIHSSDWDRTSREVVVSGEDFSGMDFAGLQFGDRVSRVTFENCDFRLARFSGANLERVVFKGGDLSRTLWAHSTIHSQVFDAATLPNLEDSIGWESCHGGDDATPTWTTLEVMDRYRPAGMISVPGYSSERDEALPGLAAVPGQVVRVDPFYIDEREVGSGEFADYVRDNPRWARTSGRDAIRNPYYLYHWNSGEPEQTYLKTEPEDKAEWRSWAATYVGFFAAVEFAASRGCRLPTDTEWEVAASAASRGEAAGHLLESLATGAKEWVLDEDAARTDTHRFENNPCVQTAELVIAGVNRYPFEEYSVATQERRRVLRGGSSEPTVAEGYHANQFARETIFEGSVNPDVGFRCVVDWCFVSTRPPGTTSLSTDRAMPVEGEPRRERAG